MGRAAAINAMPERPSSTARVTPRSAVTRARVFNNAEATANPPEEKQRNEREKFVLGHSQSSVREILCGRRLCGRRASAPKWRTSRLIYNHRSDHVVGPCRRSYQTPRLATGRSGSPITRAMTNSSDRRALAPRDYWRANLTYVGALMAVWFVISYGAGILFVEPLNRFHLPGTGFPLGFWFAQQGLHLRLCGLDLRVRVPHEPPRPRVRSGRGRRVRGER